MRPLLNRIKGAWECLTKKEWLLIKVTKSEDSEGQKRTQTTTRGRTNGSVEDDFISLKNAYLHYANEAKIGEGNDDFFFSELEWRERKLIVNESIVNECREYNIGREQELEGLIIEYSNKIQNVQLN